MSARTLLTLGSVCATLLCSAWALLLPALAAPAPADPVLPGPFAVGVIERSFTRSSVTTGAPRPVGMVIWYPAQAPAPGEQASRHGGRPDAQPDRSASPYPVLLFSHGSGGAPWQSSFLMAHLASQGFVAVAPTHPGNTADDCPASCLPINAPAREAFLDSAANRPGDISGSLDEVLNLATGGDEILGGLVAPDRVGVLGHSFGGWTALQVLMRDTRFKVAVPMAPGVFAELLARTEHVTAPTLVMAGDLDRLTRLADEELLSASLQAGGGKHWFLVLHGAGHLSFADLCGRIFGGCGPADLAPAEAHSAIGGWTTAFMQRYLNQDERYAAWMESTRPAMIDVRYSPPTTP